MTSPTPLTRSSSDKMVAGVSGGVARHLGVDPALVRAGFAAAALLSGAGLVAYLVLWAIVPRDDAADRSAAPGPRAMAA